MKIGRREARSRDASRLQPNLGQFLVGLPPRSTSMFLAAGGFETSGLAYLTFLNPSRPLRIPSRCNQGLAVTSATTFPLGNLHFSSIYILIQGVICSCLSLVHPNIFRVSKIITSLLA